MEDTKILNTFYEKHELFISNENLKTITIGSKHSDKTFEIPRDIFEELFVRDVHEENCLQIFIDEKPTTSHPPRVLKTGWSYDPKKQLKDITKSKVESMTGKRDVQKNIPIFLKICYELPYRTIRNKRHTKALEEGKINHIKRPDIDNLQKYTFDVLKGILFSDDSQICRLELRKRYSDTIGTSVTVRYQAPQEDYIVRRGKNIRTKYKQIEEKPPECSEV